MNAEHKPIWIFSRTSQEPPLWRKCVLLDVSVSYDRPAYIIALCEVLGE